jgi:FeS assembly SUF system protein
MFKPEPEQEFQQEPLQEMPETPATPASPEPGPAPAEAAPAAAARVPSDLENGIVEALKTVFDPEIPVNIYELGLIYDLDIQEGGAVQVKMTLTSPGCPVAGSLPGEVKDRVAGVPGVTSADVEVVWDPTWNPSMMSEAARLQLGMF